MGQPTLLLAKEVLNSNIQYHPNVSVNNVSSLGIDDFDVVIYTGIFYHVRDPLLAFSRLRQVMKEGAIIIVEGEVIKDHDQSFARYFYTDRFMYDESNWWLPSIRCLHEWVESSYFEVVSGENYWDRPNVSDNVHYASFVHKRDGDSFTQIENIHQMSRYLLTARAVRRHDPKYRFPDEELGRFQVD